MVSNYQETLQELLQYDIGRSAYFDISIFSNGFGNDNKVFTWLCHSAELPGESTATVSQKIYGVVEKYPVMSSYNDLTLSFYTRGSQTEQIRKKFLTWITETTGRGEVMGSPMQTTYNVPYKNDIIGTIEINHYSAAGQLITKCILKEAFPIGLHPVQLAWSAANQAISLNVTFAYTEYIYEFYNGNQIREVAKSFINPIVQQTLSNFTITPRG